MKEIQHTQEYQKVREKDGDFLYLVAGDEVYFQDVVRQSFDKINLTENNGRVIRVFLDSKHPWPIIYEIEVTHSVGDSPRKQGIFKISLWRKFLKNLHRKVWLDESLRNQKELETQHKIMEQFWKSK